MNRITTILLLLFVLLGGGAWWYTSQQNAKTSTTTLSSDNDWEMHVDDLDNIGKVFIADRNGRTATIERKNGDWLYNGKYKARPNGVNALLDVIKRVRLKFRPPNAAIDGAIKSLASHGIKVEVYDLKGENLITYYVGGVTPDERGTYMMLEGSENPYVMHIPIWEGSLRTRYFFGDDNWRDKTIFAEKLENITSVSVEYPNRKGISFILEKQNADYTVRPFNDDMPATNRPVSKGAIEAYLMGFESLVAEAFENDNEKKDSLSVELPFSIITMENNKGESKSIRLHPLVQRDVNNNPLSTTAVDRYFVSTDWGDHYLIQHLVFGKILWAYDYFYEKEDTGVKN